MVQKIRFYVTCVFCLSFNFSFAQKNESENKSQSANDTVLLGVYAQTLLDFTAVNRDSAFYYGNKALDMANKLNQKYYEGIISTNVAYNFITSGDYTKGLKYLIAATKIAEDKDLSKNIVKTPFIENFLQKDAKTNRIELLGYIKNALGILYGYTESPEKELQQMLEAKHLVQGVTNDMFLLAGITENVVSTYMSLNKFDSALYYQKEAIGYRSKTNITIYNGQIYQSRCGDASTFQQFYSR